MAKYVNYQGLKAHVEMITLLRKLRDEVILPMKEQCIDMQNALIIEREQARKEAEADDE